MTEPIDRADGDPVADEAMPRRRQFSTSVEAKDDGRWLAVVALADGATVSKLFDKEEDAHRYGDELAAWLATRGA